MMTKNEILHERAQIASSIKSMQDIDYSNQCSVVEFILTPEKYAIEEEFVTEAVWMKDYTPIPGTPAFVMGVINLRGRIVSIINLKNLLNIKERGLADMSKVLILSNNNMEFGIVTDSIIGNKILDLKTLSPPPINLNRTDLEFLKGVDLNGLILLDALAILNSQKIVVQH